MPSPETPDVKNGPPVVNYFAEGSPGKGMAANVEDEKMKLLRLLATRGTEGIAIYQEAAARTNSSADQSRDASMAAGGAAVPATVIEETKRDFDQSQEVFRRIMAESAQAARADDVRRRSIEAIYKDSVIGGIPAEQGMVQDEIDDYLKSLADAAKARRGGGGGGGGRGSSSRGGFVEPEPTLPESFLAPVDMEGLLVSPSRTAVRYNKTPVPNRIPTRANNPVTVVSNLAQRVLDVAARQGKQVGQQNSSIGRAIAPPLGVRGLSR